jgi:O-antigen/teichoic acid export membrane protein
LIPAFSGLQADADRGQYSELYARGVRFSIAAIAPSVVFSLIFAKAFFTWWAGSEIGPESTPIFYVLVIGLVFNVPTYLPYAVIMASGRTDIFAKLFAIELVPYIGLVILLTSVYGVIGTAAAWTIRAVVEAFIWFWLAKRVAQLPFSNFRLSAFAVAAPMMTVPFFTAIYFGEINIWVAGIFLFAGFAYLALLRKLVLTKDELAWLSARLNEVAGRFGS